MVGPLKKEPFFATYLREAATKVLLFSGPTTKALPPPLELSDHIIFLNHDSY